MTSIIGSGHCQSAFWGRGFRGRLRTAQSPSLAPRPPHPFTSRLRSRPRLGGDTFLRLEEERIRASWLPHSLQLPGFLIDGDYYIIDLLDRTVPALRTLCPPPRSLPAPGPGTSPTEPAAQLCRRPQPVSIPRRETLDHLHWWPWGHVLGRGVRRARSRPATSRSQGRPAEGVWLYQRLSTTVGPTWPLQPNLGIWEPREVGIGAQGPG